MIISEFLEAYLNSGNIILEVQAKDNLDDYLCMFAGLTTKPSEQDVDSASAATEAIEKLNGAGTTAYKLETKAGTTSVYYGGTGCFPGGERVLVPFTDDDWKNLVARWQEGAKLTPGDAPAESPEKKLDAKQQAKAREQQAIVEADTMSQSINERFADLGFEGENPDATRALFRQVYGFGGDNAIRKAAREREDEKRRAAQGEMIGPITPEENEAFEAERDAQRRADALVIGGVLDRTAMIVDKVKNSPDTLTEADRKFMRECLRLRGHGQDQGIYLVAGDNCGGDLIANGVAHQQGGLRYGVKIGTQKSAIFEAGKYLHDQSLKEGNPLASEDGKPAIFWGGTDAAKLSSYNAMNGVLNEYGPQLAQAWVKCGRQQPCPALQEVIGHLTDEQQYNLNLLIFGAEQRNQGEIPETLEFADVDSEGNQLILDDIEARTDGNVDGAKALAWYVGSLINAWDAVVSDPMFEGCDFEVTGRGPTGQIKKPIKHTNRAGEEVEVRHIGGRVNQDVQVTCPKLAKKLVVNNKNHVESGTGPFGEEDEKNREHWTGDEATGLNIKTSENGTDVQYGKTGAAVVDAVERDEEGNIVGFSRELGTAQARDRHANYCYGLAQNHGQRLEPEGGCEGKSDEECAHAWKEEADNYKFKEIDTVDKAMGSLKELSMGTIETCLGGMMAQMGYEDAQRFGEMEQQIKEYKNCKTDDACKQAALKIRATLTNAYRNKHKNTAGFRANMAIEYAETGMATQNQGMVITKPGGGKTYVGAESDAAGTAVANILGLGREGGPAPVKSISGTGITFEGGISLRRRVKDGSLVQEALEATDSILPRMRELSGAKAAKTGDSEVENSSMKAEDFVRQLQELIQRIDKVNTV